MGKMQFYKLRFVYICACVHDTELVVAESVVVIKKLLQMQPEQHSDIIKHMAKLTDNIQVGVSRSLSEKLSLLHQNT